MTEKIKELFNKLLSETKASIKSAFKQFKPMIVDFVVALFKFTYYVVKTVLCALGAFIVGILSIMADYIYAKGKKLLDKLVAWIEKW